MTELLYRSFVPELEIRSAANGGDGRTVDGLAVPFGRPQRISRDLTEQFARGVFNHQLAAAHRVKFSREHLRLGGVLLGRALELRDDTAGLWGAFRVSKTEAGDETLALIEDGALDELSVGFRERPRGNRTLSDGTVERIKADLFEVSVVLAGAYGQSAKVAAVRAAGDDEPLDEDADGDEQGDEHGRDDGDDEGDEGAAARTRRAAQLFAQLPVLPLV